MLLACAPARREFFPDEAAPQAAQEPFPGVDFGFTFYYVLNQSMVDNWQALSWDMLRKPAYAALYAFQAEIQREPCLAWWLLGMAQRWLVGGCPGAHGSEDGARRGEEEVEGAL